MQVKGQRNKILRSSDWAGRDKNGRRKDEDSDEDSVELTEF